MIMYVRVFPIRKYFMWNLYRLFLESVNDMSYKNIPLSSISVIADGRLIIDILQMISSINCATRPLKPPNDNATTSSPGAILAVSLIFYCLADCATHLWWGLYCAPGSDIPTVVVRFAGLGFSSCVHFCRPFWHSIGWLSSAADRWPHCRGNRQPPSQWYMTAKWGDSHREEREEDVELKEYSISHRGGQVVVGLRARCWG